MKIISAVKEYVVEEDRAFESPHAPTLLRTGKGSLLCAWFGGSWEKSPDTAIWLAQRTKEGWTEPEKAADTRNRPMWNPVLSSGPDGRIILYYKVGERIEEWKTWSVESTDEGETWSDPAELVPGDTLGGRGPVKNKPVLLRNGDILAPASLEGETWDSFVDISCDGGRSWEQSTMVPLRRAGFNGHSLDAPYSRYRCFGKGVIQPALWEDIQGEVHMLMRSTSSRIFRSDSKDRGRTWGLAYATSLPNNNSGIDLTVLENGGLVLACNPVENLPNYYKGPRTPLTLLYSEDNGENWKELITLEDAPGGYAYPSIISHGNRIEVVYTWKRERIAYWSIIYEG